MVDTRTEALPGSFIGREEGGLGSLVLSRRGASWLLPIDGRRVTAAGFCLVRPKSLAETVAWHAARWMAYPRVLGRHVRDGVGLRDDLARGVCRELGRPDLRFALAIPQADRAAVAAITPSGEVVAFAKLGASEAATSRIEREHAALRMVRSKLPPSVQAPEVLFRGALGGVEALLMSPVGGGRAAVTGRLRAPYLRGLAALVSRGEGRRLGALLPSPAPLGDEWVSLLSMASARLARWEAVTVRTALVHGDFAPWNLVSHGRGVAAYDWEDAREEGAPFWDLWHFAVQSAALLNRWSDKNLVAAAVRLRGHLGSAVRWYAGAAQLSTDLAAPVLAAYLMASGTVVGRHGELTRPDRVHGLRFRARVLAALLEAWR